MKITWDNGPNESYDSAEYKKELRETSHKPGKLIRGVGDSDKAPIDPAAPVASKLGGNDLGNDASAG